MCSDGLDSWFAAMPLFGEVSEKHWDRLELDYDMEASPRNLMMVPPVCTATLYRASVIPVDYLKRRVREIVAANPWLSGRLRKSFDSPFLAIPKTLTEDHFMECGPSFSIHPETSFYDVVKHVQGTEAVLKNGLAALNRNEALFRVAVIPAEPNHFLLVVSLNHTIGDGFTFYKLCGMLDPSVPVISMNPIRQVGFAKLAKERIGPNHFNWLTTCPTLLGLLRSFCLWHPEEPEVRYVDQEYISKLKSEAEIKVSTNDILTSHLLQKSRFGYGYMSINLRNRGLGANDGNAGNYVHRIHLAPERFQRPEGVRKSLTGPETMAPPGWWASLTQRHGLVSNWSHFFQEVHLPGSMHVAHMPVLPYPPPGFGLILIFKPSQNTLAVYYMIKDKEAFADVSSSDLLGPFFNPFSKAV